jgi:hypothetical protein
MFVQLGIDTSQGDWMKEETDMRHYTTPQVRREAYATGFGRNRSMSIIKYFLSSLIAALSLSEYSHAADCEDFLRTYTFLNSARQQCALAAPSEKVRAYAKKCAFQLSDARIDRVARESAEKFAMRRRREGLKDVCASIEDSLSHELSGWSAGHQAQEEKPAATARGAGDEAVDMTIFGRFAGFVKDGEFFYGNKVDGFSFNFRRSFMRKLFLVLDPRKPFACEDGLPVSSPLLIEITADNAQDVLKNIQSHLFSFFSAKPTTVGFLVASAGASGGGVQALILIDTDSGNYSAIENLDCTPIKWLETGDYPPAFGTSNHWYLGGRAESLGLSSTRIEAVYSFENNDYKRNRAFEGEWFQRAFRNSILTDREVAYLRARDMRTLSSEWRVPETQRLLEKLLDYILYAQKTNNIDAVLPVIKSLDPSVQEEIRPFLR